jgi:uncharacterized protein (UPF0371 family)
VNVAYEAATADLDDHNIIDPFHLDAYGKVTVNYNRDVEAFPVVKDLLERISGKSPYQSPTDMGVNMVGKCIDNDMVVSEAGRKEIVRRWFWTAEKLARTGQGEEELAKIELIMKKAEVSKDISPARKVALAKAEESGAPAGAMELADGTIVSGKTKDILGAASSLLLNALKRVAAVDEDDWVVTDEALEPICNLKIKHLGHRNPRLHIDEVLLALSICALTDINARNALEKLDELRCCEVHTSVILSGVDENVFRRLKVNVTCEPHFENQKLYHR